MVAATANASEDLVNLVCSVSLSGSFNFFNHHIRAKLKDMLRGHPALSKFLLEPAKEDRSLAQKALHVGLFKDLDFSSEVKEVHNRYPLMAVIDRGLGYYASAHDAERNIKALVQYIQLIDKANEEALVVKEGAA
jgi:hypothetical protein